MNTAIHPETQYSDFIYVPDPDRSAERARLGLLGRLVADPCLREFYSAAPGAEEVLACLSKPLAIWQERLREQREARAVAGALRRLVPVDHRGRRAQVGPDQAQGGGGAGAPVSIAAKPHMKLNS